MSFRGDFVLNPVTLEGLAVRGPEGETVEGPGRSPHDVSPGFVVVGLLHDHGDEMKDGLHEPFHDPVENIKVGAHEIDFKVMDEGMVNFHSKCKMLSGVAEFFSEAFLCRFPPEDLPRPVVYPVHSLPV